MNSISEQIDSIGAELVQDTFLHSDIVCKAEEGIIPRCLIYEAETRDRRALGAVVVGINPGRASQTERQYYLDHGCTYDSVKAYWLERLAHDHRYYSYLREFLDAADHKGPILWTELVKCESAVDVKQLSVQTIRDSIDQYLIREIACVPDTWPLIGVGGIGRYQRGPSDMCRPPGLLDTGRLLVTYLERDVEVFILKHLGKRGPEGIRYIRFPPRSPLRPTLVLA